MGFFDFLKKKDDSGKGTVKAFEGKIVAPITGTIIPIEEVDDAVFAEKMVGDGIAIVPNASGVMVAPITGTVEKIFDTNHAFSILTEDGIELFVHFGVDTVKLQGEGFKRLVEEGSKVEQGTPLIEYDYEFLKANAKSVQTPIIISNYEDYAPLSKMTGEAKAGETLVLEVLEK